MVTLAPTSVGQITLGQQDMVLPQFIPRDILMGSGGLMHVPQQQQPQSQMPPQAYANCAMGPLQVHFSIRVEPPTDSYVMCLVSVMVFAS